MKFGEYETVRLLDTGGMSEVWEAVNPRLGMRCAVKAFSHADDGADLRARFEQEGRVLAALRHPRIVGVHDLGTAEDGRPYIVMDLVLNPDGKPQTLADVAEGGVDEEAVARWYDDIREGLAYVHAKGIVHRDLKLQNVMVGPDGHAVLTDFGIARVSEKAKVVADSVNTIARLRDGKPLVMGSLGYMAPELEMGCEATAQSDWYALGVIVFRLLTGTWCEARTDVSGALDTYDPVWLRIVPKLLHANPAGRACPSFAETRRVLGASSEAAEEALRTRERIRSRAMRALAFATTGVALLLSAALLAVGSVCRSRLRNCQIELRQFQERFGKLQQNPGARALAPTFDDLFAIPAEAKQDTAYADDGTETMPSRSDFEASRIDMLVLVTPSLSELVRGSVTCETVANRFDDWAARCEDEDALSPLDGVKLGDMDYTCQWNDRLAYGILLRQAAERLRAWGDR